MNRPALPGLTRVFAALLIAATAAMGQAEHARGQETKQQETKQPDTKQQPQQATGQQAVPFLRHEAVPFIELGQVRDKGTLRLLPPRSVTRHTIATDSGPVG